MKQILLGMAICLSAGSALAGITYPRYYASDFVKESEQGYDFPQGYVSYGVEGTIESTWANFFPNYSASNAYTFVGLTSGEVISFTPNGLTANGAAVPSDQWLISPEITVQDDNALVNFTIYQSGSSATQHASLYISEGGTAKEDFVKVKDYDFKGTGGTDNVGSTQYNAILEGYKDKTVRLAFVSHDNTAGIMGFADIMVGQYYVSISNENQLNNILIDPAAETTQITVNFVIQTPISIKGFTAVLRTEKGQEFTFNNTRTINSTKYYTYPIRYTEKIEMDGADEQGFTITITPNSEELAPIVITGNLVRGYGEPYQANALVEEITGAWCGWCPGGIAFMEYYKDKYNSLGKGKVIPMMLHNGDIMNAPSNYFIPVLSKMINTVGAQNVGYPTAMVNRIEVGSPTSVGIPSVVENGTSLAQTTILEAGPASEDSSKIRVKVANKAALNATGAPISMSIVLIENDVHGTNGNWNQMDYYPEYYTAQQIKDAYGEEMWPYWAQFFEDAVKYGTHYYVPGAKMYYPDVVRGIAPSYDGVPLYGWTNGEVRNDEWTIDIPSTVQKIENCSVVVILAGPDGSIVGSDIIAYEDWAESVEGSGIKAVSNNALTLTAIPVADGLGIKLTEKSQVAVYSIDGRQIFAGVLQPGEHIIPVAKSQTVIVRAESAGSTATAKVIL